MESSAETLRYGIVMLAAGIGVPILAALNANLGVRLSSPAAAATCLFAVGFVVAFAVLLMTGPRAILAAPAQPLHLFGGGLFVAFYVLSVTWIAPKLGVGNAVIIVLLGQMIAFAVIDHFGLMGAIVKPLNLQRIAGIALMAAGVILAQRA